MEENIKKKHVIIKTQYTRHDHESIWEFPHLQGVVIWLYEYTKLLLRIRRQIAKRLLLVYYLGVAQIDRLFKF